jgi:hypothetical protein
MYLARHSSFIINAGWAGSTVVNWNASQPGPADPIPTIETIAPTLCIIMIDGNDAGAGTSIPTFTADKQNLITACKASGDVLLITSQPAPPSALSYATLETNVAADVSLATTNNIPILNFFQTFCNYSGGSCFAPGLAD